MTCVSGAVKISNNVNLASIRLDKAQRLEGGVEISVQQQADPADVRERHVDHG